MRTVVVLLAIVTCGCSKQPRDEARVPTERTYVLTGVTIHAPHDTGWELLRSDQAEAVFQRQDANATASISARTVPIDRVDDDQAFLAFAEARQQEGLRTLQMISIHFNHTRFKNTVCLQYDGIFRDTLASSPDRVFLTTKGYLCRHPATALQAIHMDLSQRSASKTLPETENTLLVGQAFFDSAEFTRHGLAP